MEQSKLQLTPEQKEFYSKLPKDALWNLPYHIQKASNAEKIAYLDKLIRRWKIGIVIASVVALFISGLYFYLYVEQEVSLWQLLTPVAWIILPFTLRERVTMYRNLRSLLQEFEGKLL